MRGRTTARTAVIGTVVATLGLLSFAGVVLAKGEGIVTLAAPIQRDADPGSTLTVVFTVTGLGDADSRPVSGWPIVLRLTAPDGSYNEALGVERGASGTYVATIDVPAGGIATADFAVQGISTFADGSTERSDMPLAVDGVLLTTKANPAPAPAAPAAATPVDPPPAAPALDVGLAVLGAAIAAGAGIIAGLLYLSGRRRSLRSV